MSGSQKSYTIIYRAGCSKEDTWPFSVRGGWKVMFNEKAALGRKKHGRHKKTPH